MIATQLFLGATIWSQQAAIGTESPIEPILRTLPIDTETIVVVQGSGPAIPGAEKIGPSIMSWPASFSQGKLQFLSTLPATSIVFGARKFQYPDSIGVGSFEGSWIASLNDTNLASAKATLGKTILNRSNILGHNVLSCAEKTGLAEIRHFYVVIIDRTLIVATNTGYLESILKRMDSKPIDHALPDTLEEWKYVDKSSNFWAIRHINPATQLKSWGLDMGDKEIRGFGASITKDGYLRVVNISDNPRGIEIAKKYWGSDLLKPKVTAISKTATEIMVDKDPSQLGMGFFYLTIAMGYAIAI